jgi:hypothetical protein
MDFKYTVRIGLSESGSLKKGEGTVALPAARQGQVKQKGKTNAIGPEPVRCLDSGLTNRDHHIINLV